MKEFLQVLRRFVPPYKKYLGLSVLFNVLSAILNIFSFAALIPILQILFQVDGGIRANDYMTWNGDWGTIKEVATNNLYYYIQEFIVAHSASAALLVIGLFLAFMTFLKTTAYFLSSATIIPIRTGIVRDIRNQLYQKITSLSLGFFSEERKGDIIARMSGDVQEVESSIMSSLDMLFKNPVLILFYFCTLVRLVHGTCRKKVESAKYQCPIPLERHDEHGGGDPRRIAHHQGFLCRGQDEHALQPGEQRIS